MARRKGFAAVQQLAQRAQDARGGDVPTPDRFDHAALDSLARWRDAYLESLAVRNYSPATVSDYRASANYFLTWAAERDLTRASQVTRLILESYQRSLWRHVKPNGQRLSWNAQRDRLLMLKGWFRWLTRQNVILHNPASELELPRPEKKLPQDVLTQSQVEKLLAVPDVGDPLGVRDRTMLEIFYSTGIRRAELCHLELSDVNTERRTLHIRKGKGKKDRVVPVGARALAWVERYLREVRPRLCLDTRTQALFLTGYGGAFNLDTVSRMVADWLKQAGVPRKGGCHTLRHACATHMLEHGADIRFIQQLLGHSNLDTTAIYTEVSIRQLQEVHARCHPSSQLPAAAGEAAANGAEAAKLASVPVTNV